MNSHFSKLSFLAFAVCAVLPASGLAQVVVGNAGTESSVTLNNIDETIGQVFATPDSPQTFELSSFQVSLLAGNSASVNAFVSTWDTTGFVPVTTIWSSGTTVISGPTTTFDTGNLVLDPALTYVFGLQVDPSTPSGTLGVATTTASTYGTGAFANLTALEAQSLGGSFSTASWVGSEWVNLSTDGAGDEGLTFSATFTPVPETSTYAIGGVILCLGLVLYFHRKRHLTARTVAPSIA